MSTSIEYIQLTKEKAIRSTDQSLRYRPDIDGLRAIAVLAVVGFHAAPKTIAGGFVGVDIFFVISGFLITGIILRSLTQGSFNVLDFYARRVRRIFPALVAMLITAVVIGWLLLLPDEFELLGKFIAAGAGFVLNIALYSDTHSNAGYAGWTLNNLWSLGVEEQFYILWPMFLTTAWKFLKRPYIAISAATATSFLLYNSVAPSDPGAAVFLFWNRLWELALGGVLAYWQLDVVRGEQSSRAKPLSVACRHMRFLDGHARGLIGIALLSASLVGFSGRLQLPGWWILVPCIGTSLLISAGPKSFINRYILAASPMVFIGQISYPLYLWHWPVMIFAHVYEWRQFITDKMTAITVCVSFILAYLTYKFVELPLRFPRQKGRTAVSLCVAMVACACVGLMIFCRIIPARAQAYDVGRFVSAATEDWLPHVHNTLLVSGLDHVTTVGSGVRQTVVIGDSNAGQYYPRVEKLISDSILRGRTVVFAVWDGCVPVVVEIADTSEVDREACKRHVQHALDYVKDHGVDTVIIAGSWYNYFVSFRDLDHFGEAGGLKSGTDEAIDSLKRLIIGLTGSGKRVYVVLTNPIGYAFDPRQMIVRSALAAKVKFPIHSPDEVEVLKSVGPIDSKLRKMAQESGATAIDPKEFLCNRHTCPVIAPNDEPMYHDMWNLRPSYVRENVSFLDVALSDPSSGYP